MPFSTSRDNEILDHTFGKATWAAQAEARFVGLSSTTPTKAGGNVTEEGAGGYARINLLAADMAVAASSTTSNTAEQAFAQATADWLSAANLTDMVMFTLVTAGTFIMFKALTVAKPVLNGDTAKFAVGDMDFTMAGAA